MCIPYVRPVVLPNWHGGRDAVHVWLAELDQPADVRRDLAQWLSSDEQVRAQGYYREQDRHSFIVARGILRVLLGSYLQCCPRELRFVYGPRGKPEVAPQQNQPVLHFNLSHAGNQAIIACSWTCEVGVDLEYIRPLAELERLIQRCFSDQEQLAFQHVPMDRKLATFYNGWTRKEAYLKATGQGLSQPLKQLTVSLLPEEPARLITVANQPDEAQRWRVLSFSPEVGYIAALVFPGLYP